MAKNFQSVVLGWAGLALLGLSVAANGVEISEYFNDYGSTQTQFFNLPTPNGGTGWASNYNAYNGGDPNDWTDYVPGDSVTPAVTGYSAPQNLTGATNGTARHGQWGSWYSYRATGLLTGTVWVSSAFRVGTDNNQTSVEFSLDSNSSSSTNNGVLLRNSVADSVPWRAQGFTYNGTTTWIPNSTYNFAKGAVSLLVARIIIDETGNNDRLTVWTHPGDVSSIAALGTPDFDQATADVFGTSFDYFGFKVQSGTIEGSNPAIDSIRISNDGNLAFGFVTTGMVPEPATLSLLALGGLALLRRRTT